MRAIGTSCPLGGIGVVLLILGSFSVACSRPAGFVREVVEIEVDMPSEARVELAHGIAADLWRSGIANRIRDACRDISDAEFRQALSFTVRTDHVPEPTPSVAIVCGMSYSEDRHRASARKAVRLCAREVRDALAKRLESAALGEDGEGADGIGTWR